MAEFLIIEEDSLGRCASRIGFNETELERWWTKKKLKSEKSGYFNKELYALIQKVKLDGQDAS